MKRERISTQEWYDRSNEAYSQYVDQGRRQRPDPFEPTEEAPAAAQPQGACRSDEPVIRNPAPAVSRETAPVATTSDPESDATNTLVEVVAEHGPAWVVAACEMRSMADASERREAWLSAHGFVDAETAAAQYMSLGCNAEGVRNA